MPIARIAALITAVLVSLGAASADAPTRFLAFQMFTDGPGMGRDDGDCGLTGTPSRDEIRSFVRDLRQTVGTRGSGSARLAVMIGPLTFDQREDDIRTLIRDGFAVAREEEIAVGFHIDESKFWSCRSDLAGDPSNIEHVDWTAPPSAAQHLNWGESWRIAPQLCLNTPAVEAAARRQAGEVIGPAVAGELTHTDPKRFAGVIAGWETALGLDADTGRRTGYCALANLGHGPGMTGEDRAQALQGVLATWISLWSGELAAAGVPRDRLYSHIAFLPRTRHDGTGGAPGYSEAVGHSTVETAFGETHLSGFSTYPDADTFGEIHAALERADAPGWASSEGANVFLDPAGPREPDAPMESYLAAMFNHSATLTVIFGWGLGPAGDPFTSAAERPEALAAYDKFLNGGDLQGSPGDFVFTPGGALPEKIARMQDQLRTFAAAGGDMSGFPPRMTLIERHLQAGEIGKAEKIVDEILTLIAP